MSNKINSNTGANRAVTILVLGISFMLPAVVGLTTNAQVSSRTEISNIVMPEPRKVFFNDPVWREKVSLDVLAQESTFIAVATTLSNVGKGTTQPQAVDTIYRLKITEIIKGLPEANEITVSMPGGLIKEPNGGLLISLTHHLSKMTNNKSYVIFLRPSGEGFSTLAPVRGSQGIYELPSDGSPVIHLGSTLDPPPGQPRQDQSVFLEAVRRFRSN